MTLMTGGRPHMLAMDMSMRELAAFLSSQIDRPVVDQTNRGGIYDFRLTWAPAGGSGGMPELKVSERADAADVDGPTIFTAIEEQLGLKLVAGRGSVEVLVVDNINKMPTEN